jgi:PAS domain S-box-containing protein
MPEGHRVTRSHFGRASRFLFAVPALSFVLAVAVLSHGASEWSHDAPFVLLILNTLFLVLSPALASYLAARSTMASGSSSTLLMGCGLLAIASSSLGAGWVRGGTGGADDATTVYNLGFMLASLFSFAAAWIGISENSRLKALPAGKNRVVLVAYAGVIIFVALLMLAAAHDITPVFFTQYQGPTLPRQIVLSLAVTFFALSSLMFFQLHQRSRASFLLWYCLALVLIAQGLGIVLFQRSLGSPINWLGRAFQFIGGVCFLIALLEGSREARMRGASFVEMLPAIVDIARLRDAEEALLQSEERLRVLVEASFEGIAITENGRFVDVNEQLCQLSGYTRSELLGREVAFLLPSEEQERVMGNITAGRDTITTHGLVCKDGGIVPVEAHGKTDRAGERSLRYTAIRDTSEQQAAKEALVSATAEAERRAQEAEEGKRVLDAIMKYIPEGITIASAPHVTTTHTSTYGHELLARGWDSEAGFSLEDWLARMEHFLPDGKTPARAEDLPLWKAVKLGEAVMGQELMIRNPGGHLLPVLCNAGPIRDSNGNVMGGVVAWREISDRKQAERATELHLAVMETVAEGIFLVGVDDNLIKWTNRKFEKMFGYDPGEMIGMHVDRVNAPTNRTPTETRISIVDPLLAHGEWHGEIRSIKKDGTRFWCQIHVSLFDHPEFGKVMVSAHTDITERKRMEEERDATIEFLRLINSSAGTKDLVGSAISFFQRLSGCEALGIRLREGEDYPYLDAKGFPAEFIRLENRPGTCDEDGKPLLDAEGGTLFECMCGKVISGRFDSSSPFFTKGGSFWTNSTTELMAATAEADLPARARDFCSHTRHESVALIPLRAAGEKLGLLQLNDSRMGMFTLEDIGFWERLAGYLSISLAKTLADEAFHKSEDKFRRIFESDMLPVAFWRSDGSLTEANKAWCDLIGYTPEQVRSEQVKWTDITPPEILWRDRQAIEQLNAKGHCTPYEKQFVHRDGRTVPVFIGGGLVGDAKDQGVAFAFDLSELKRKERDLEAARHEAVNEKHRLEAVMEALPVGVAIVDTEGGTVKSNPAFQQAWGGLCPDTRSVGDYAAYTAWWADTGRLVEPEEWAAAIAIRKGEAVTGQLLQIARFDGMKAFVHNSAAPVFDAQGRISGSAVVIMDITRHVEAEEALKKTKDELEIRVRERTEELQAYMQKLQESNQALQDFASIASHDMQEPLRKVQSFGNMLKKKYGDTLGEGGKDYLERMLNATDRMGSLLTSLLDYSRVSSRAEPFREVKLSAIIRDVLDDLEVRIRSTGGEVRVGDLPTIEADPTQMRQLFQNLIANALKFHKEGDPPVVKVRCSSKGAGKCEISVEDNGIGFDERYIERIFAPFQRLHGRSSQYEGTGMGLAICKKIVERHGGAITARSSPGEGSVFITSLPAGS